MKQISLTQNKFALVDDEDFDRVSQFNWCYSNKGYAKRGRSIPGTGKQVTELMHRFVLQTPEGFDTDHIDGNRLNNQKSNLRVATRAQNLANAGPRNNNKSGFRGIWAHGKKWEAKIGTTYLGTFFSRAEASEAYRFAARNKFGKYAYGT